MEAFHLNGWDVREIRDWGCAVVLCHEAYGPSIAPGYFTSKGKWIKPRSLPAGAAVEHQNPRKTCRAFARVYGWCVAVRCDDTAIEFIRLENGRVKEITHAECRITWEQVA